MLPLEGITVISLEQTVAAPFATRQLADLGARVIKIERPGVGDFARGATERLGFGAERLREEHTQLEARDRWREVDSPVGPIRALVPPVTMQGVESVMELIPEVGEHTYAILEKIDLDPDAVGSLREAGAV